MFKVILTWAILYAVYVTNLMLKPVGFQGGQEHAQDNTYFEEVLTYLIVLIILVKKMI